MNKDYLLLVKKDFKEKIKTLKRTGKERDIIGFFISLALAFGLIAVFVFVFREFVAAYTKIKFFGVEDTLTRQLEILTIAYALIFLFGIFSGIKKINDNINNNKDLQILIILPIRTETLFLAKLTNIFLSHLISTIIIVVPLSITFGLVTAQGFVFVLMTALVCLIIPVVSLMFAAVLALPTYHLVRHLKSKFVLLTILFVLLIAAGFLMYSVILRFIKNLLESGEIRFFFNEEKMLAISSISKYLYPSKIFAEIVLSKNLLINLLITALIIALCVLSTYFVVKSMFLNLAKRQMDGDLVYTKKSKPKAASVLPSLIKKEFITVMRTPSYSFQYFATTLTLPLMIFTSLSITSSLIAKLIFINCNFELAIFIITMFSVLTNTFCASNISREGSMLKALKAMPYTPHQIIMSKVIFSSITSLIAIFISVLSVVAGGYISIVQGIFAFIITSLLSLAEIFFATRKDFNRPHIEENQNNELEESNSTISLIVLLGIIISSVLCGILLYSSIVLKAQKGAAFGLFVSIGSVSLIAVLLFAGSLVYLLKGLGDKYYELGE